MAEYIEREAAIAYIRDRAEERQRAFDEFGAESNGIYADAYTDLAEDFYKIPSIDVVPVRHGRWETHYRSGTTVLKGVVSGCCDMWNGWKTPYCPNCGAKMDGKDGDENEGPDGSL